MTEALSFHFEGALADGHRMNFYEAARFQYAAARLMVKLSQFRQNGRFVKNITDSSNYDIQLATQSDGSFNINVESPNQVVDENTFVRIPLADLVSYVSERIIEKIDVDATSGLSDIEASARSGARALPAQFSSIDQLVQNMLKDRALTDGLPAKIQYLIKRRAAETFRERRLEENQEAIARIDFARGQKLIAMSAPLIREMATALRRSADTLEVKSHSTGESRSVLFLDQKMAREIETAIVDEEITPILGDIIQFNKDNGWGKIRISSESKIVSFSIPYDLLGRMKQKLIDNMKNDQVYLQTYYVRDRSNELVRLIAVGILPTPIS